MGTILQGADLKIWVAAVDVTCDVLHASWAWGASAWAGPLTIPEAGTLTIVFDDPERELDPGNPAGSSPAPGAELIVTVDSVRAWTGFVADVTHSLLTHESTVLGHDAIATLSSSSFSGAIAAGTTVQNFNAILDTVQWPGGTARIVEGAPVGYRAAGTEPEQAWPALLRVARAELGTVSVDRQGRISFHTRGIDDGPPPAILPVIGCDGADLDDVTSLMERDKIVNHVLIEPDDTNPIAGWTDAASITAYGRRSIRAKRDEIRLVNAPGALLRPGPREG